MHPTAAIAHSQNRQHRIELRRRILLPGALAALLSATSALALSTFTFSTGNPDGLMATGSRPGTNAVTEIESADDFVVSGLKRIDHASFTGLLPTGKALSAIGQVRVEIYRVFPLDSTNPPSGAVPTRVNSPSDVAFEERSTIDSNLTFTATVLNASFTANNSVLNGIHPSPNQTTGGEGSVTGEEVRFDVTFNPPLLLPADHYFFIPQVEVTGGGDFYWLSSTRPVVSPGTPFSPDLQSWIRNAGLDPNWLRIGTDIVGGATPPTFNSAFSLSGETVADLSITKSAPSTATVGGQIAYSINVSNAAVSSNASNVVVVDTLPAGTIFGSFAGAGWTCVEAPAGTVTCTLASLGTGTAAAPLTLNVFVQASGSLVNSATVHADQTDINLADNTATASIQVARAAAIPALDRYALLALLMIIGGLFLLRRTR